MIAEELINQMIPPLKHSDTVLKAMQWMEELRINQLPVIEQGAYKGLISEEIIYEYNKEDALVKDLRLDCSDVFVWYHEHFFDILRKAKNYNIEIVAVLGEEHNFLGVVTIQDIISVFAESTSMQEQGGILVLSMDSRDYSLAEIGRIVESNDAKILTTHISEDKQNHNKIRVTLKINNPNLNPIIATFERFDYKVIAKFQSNENDKFEEDRLNMLFKYLDI